MTGSIATPEERDAAFATVLRFFHLVDHGRAGETAALFTVDAVLTFGAGSPQPGSIVGPAISVAMEARGRQTGVTTRHVISNMTAQAKPDGSIVVRSLLTLYRSDDETRDPAPRSIADVEDILVLTGDAWCIKARLIQPIFGLA